LILPRQSASFHRFVIPVTRLVASALLCVPQLIVLHWMIFHLIVLRPIVLHRIVLRPVVLHRNMFTGSGWDAEA